jgi:hypothetical protein
MVLKHLEFECAKKLIYAVIVNKIDAFLLASISFSNTHAYKNSTHALGECCDIFKSKIL